MDSAQETAPGRAGITTPAPAAPQGSALELRAQVSARPPRSRRGGLRWADTHTSEVTCIINEVGFSGTALYSSWGRESKLHFRTRPQL